MPRAKKQAWRCKATDPATSRRCTRKAKNDGWCATCKKRIAPPIPSVEGRQRIIESNQKRVKHGLYSKYWTEDEQSLGLELQQQRGTLHDELDDQRIMLRRINAYIALRQALLDPGVKLSAQERQERTQALQGQFEDVEVKSEVEGTIITNPDGTQRIQYQGTPKRSSIRRALSMQELYNLRDRYSRHLSQLELDAKDLGSGRGGDPREQAQKIRDALKEMMEANDVPSPFV